MAEISRFPGRNTPHSRIAADRLEKLDNSACREVAKVVSTYEDLVTTTGPPDTDTHAAERPSPKDVSEPSLFQRDSSRGAAALACTMGGTRTFSAIAWGVRNGRSADATYPLFVQSPRIRGTHRPQLRCGAQHREKRRGS
jgi:hypothetical protein